MKKIILAILLFLFVIGITNSCKHEPIAIPLQNNPNPEPGLVCFETEILPLFQSNCAKSNCHDASSHEKGYIFDNYTNIISKDIIPGNAANSKVYEVLFETGNDKMPPSPNPDLTSVQKALIGRWINEGAQNTSNCGTTCDTGNFKFSTAISIITSTYCIGCHGGTTPAAGINLTNYSGVAAVAQSGRLYNAITHTQGYSPMPKNAQKLNDCQIIQVRKWIDDGTPNN